MLGKVSLLFVLFFTLTAGEPRCEVDDDAMHFIEYTEKDLPKTPQPKVTILSFSNSSFPIIRKKFIDLFPNLEALFASGSQIENIEDDAFQNRPSLRTIHLGINKLTWIHPDLLQNTPHVYSLNLMENPNLVLPGDRPFLNAPHLKLLGVYGCNIENVTEKTFENLRGLKDLGLDVKLYEKLEALNPNHFLIQRLNCKQNNSIICRS